MKMSLKKLINTILFGFAIGCILIGNGYAYVVVDTDQTKCYNETGEITCPSEGSDFYGQDATYSVNIPSYTNNSDGTITDNNTGLMWQQAQGSQVTYDEAVALASVQNTGGYTDWRLPSIKELYSLIQFSGQDVSGLTGDDTSGITPFIDTAYFGFAYGDTSTGDRIIDVQYVSSTKYVSTTMGGNSTVFGVNFADGRIKGYGTANKSFYVKYIDINIQNKIN